MDILSCKNIEIKFGYETIVSSVNLSLNSSEKWALVGVNGCGKTSLLRILAGLAKPADGEVYCMQDQIWPHRESTKEHYSLFLSCQPSLLLDHSVLWNLEYYCRCFGIQKSKEDTIEALKNVGLLEKINLASQLLSTGQKRRLTLAALELIRPKIILADEPTNGLDEAGSQLCLDIFDKLCVENKTSILVATHDKNLIQWCHHHLNLEQFAHKNCGKKLQVKDLL